MKRILGAVIFLCMMMVSARAMEQASLPGAVETLCAQSYPGYSVSAYSGFGDDSRGQFALALSKEEQHILCIAEKSEADAAYRFTVENDKALRKGEEVPSLLIDTAGDSLFFSYQEIQHYYSYHAVKDETGAWGNVDLIVYDGFNSDEFAVFAQDELIIMDFFDTDNEGNILSRARYTPVPGKWLQPFLALNDFDITVFPTNRDEAMAFGGREEAAKLFLPEGAVAEYSGVAPAALAIQAALPDGSRCAYLCQWSEKEGWRSTKTAALPEGAGIDTFHFGDALFVNMVEDGEEMYCAFSPRANGTWVFDFFWDYKEKTVSVYSEGIQNSVSGQVCYGVFPDIDIRTVEWDKLPRTMEEAYKRLDTTGFAMVASNKKEERLNLRIEPKKDAKALGKYYSGTRVQVLEEKDEWARVNIYGVEGWMMKAFLSFGEEMLQTPVYYPDLSIRDEALAEGVYVYAQPNEKAESVKMAEPSYSPYPKIIGVVGDEWFHVLLSDSITGYVKQICFWAGNG